MALSEAQAKENADQYSQAMAEPVACRATGKLLAMDEETGEWVPAGDVHPLHRNFRWPWQGHVYGPDKDGFVREIKGRKPLIGENGKQVVKRGRPAFEGVFGGGIPRAGFEHYQRLMRTAGGIAHRYEVIEEENAPVAGVEKPIEKMTVPELDIKLKEKGIAEEVYKGMNKADKIELLKA